MKLPQYVIDRTSEDLNLSNMALRIATEVYTVPVICYADFICSLGYANSAVGAISTIMVPFGETNPFKGFWLLIFP